MEIEHVTKKVRSLEQVDELLDAIEAGTKPKPDWIQFQAKADPSKLGRDALAALVARMHGCVLRGFKANKVKIGNRAKRLAYWQTIAQGGFHDFAEDCWTKCYDSPFVENYDYVTPYEEGGLEALDPYAVYSSVLGTWEYSVEDFLHTDLAKDVRTIVEPLAGTAEFCYLGHFFYPDLSYCMFDLDEHARRTVEARRWLEGTRREFLIGNALDEALWQRVAAFADGPSLSYIGKQSQNFFDVHGLVKIMEWGTKYTDHLVLEVSEPYLIEEGPEIDELTRPEMKDAGFRTALDDLEDFVGNPLTNVLDFDLVVWDEDDRRILFEYHEWIGWQAPTLVALGRLLGLEVLYFHSEQTEFLPVERDTDTADCRDNNTFLLFRRP